MCPCFFSNKFLFVPNQNHNKKQEVDVHVVRSFFSVSLFRLRLVADHKSLDTMSQQRKKEEINQ